MLRDARAVPHLLALATRSDTAANTRMWLGYRPFDRAVLASIAAATGPHAEIAKEVVAKFG